MSVTGPGAAPLRPDPGAPATPAAPAPAAEPPLKLASALLSEAPDLAAVAAGSATIALGTSGEGARTIQQALVRLGHDPALVGTDGVFGRGTERAIAQLQRENGLSPTGVVDRATLAALDAKVALAPLAPPRGASRMLYESTGGIGGRDVEFEELSAYVGGAQTVTVAIADTGFDPAHPLLADNVFTNPGEVPGDGIDNDGNRLVDDVSGWDFRYLGPTRAAPTTDPHGMHVAGIAAYGTDRIKVLDVACSGKTERPATAPEGPAIAAAIDYARSMGARVVNASFSPDDPDEYFHLRLAVERNPDLLFINSAGNYSTDVDNPEETELGEAPTRFKAWLPAEHVLVVANTTREDRLASSSNWGAKSVDVGAVGEKVRSAWLPGARDAEPGADGGAYRVASGTSMSAPFVSNVAAKLFALCPSLTALEARRLILETVDGAPALRGKVATGGVVNPLRAYRCAALIARIEKGEDLDRAIAALPGGAPDAAQRAKLAALARDVVAKRPQ